jgi:hypothetical protein|uniref:hypothetical protein n=1 Tax=Bacteroidales TaxID=171549 RepID=UPI00206867C6|nr:MAG TPA: hypothetical protein [Caudoviricetes sp.]
MKKLLLIFTVAVLIHPFAQGQTAKSDEQKSNSKAIEFLQSNGTFIIKEFYDLPKVKTLECQVLILTDIVNKKKMGCLRLETVHFSSYSKSADTYVGTLDFDELDACIQSLTYIKDNLLPSMPTVYTEAEYKTLDNVKLGAFYGSDKWETFVYTKGYTSRSAVFFDSASIELLISVMNQAKQIISEKVKPIL